MTGTALSCLEVRSFIQRSSCKNPNDKALIMESDHGSNNSPDSSGKRVARNLNKALN